MCNKNFILCVCWYTTPNVMARAAYPCSIDRKDDKEGEGPSQISIPIKI